MSTKTSLRTLFKNYRVFMTIYFTFLSLGVALVVISITSYNYLLNSFKSHFLNGDFTSANNIIISNGNLNPVKSLLLNRDLKFFMKDFFDETLNSYHNKEISQEDALIIVNEIEKYIFLSDDIKDFKSTLPIIKESNAYYEEGIIKLSSNNYKEAIDSFSMVSIFDDNYKSSLDYKKESLDNYKLQVLAESQNLANEKYYSKAIENIESNLGKYLTDDVDIKETLALYQNNKETYLASLETSTSTTASSNTIASISLANINSLNLSSYTSSLIYVNKSKQTTYVYTGSTNSWKLDKTFLSSTGITGKDTPSGVFEVLEKGEWFFSEKYQQGAKYWVQFKGNYLFHSLPFSKDKKTIVDYTLGTATSHGCVRLSLEDAKWLYDNVKKGTKVIIN